MEQTSNNKFENYLWKEAQIYLFIYLFLFISFLHLLTCVYIVWAT
jgi:hypothetical protein